VALGSPAYPGSSGATPGQAFRVYVWGDANGDGVPTGADFLGEATGSVDAGSIDTDVVQIVSISPPIPINGSFFVGASINSPAGGYPATADDDGWTGPPNQAFLTFNSVPFDPNDIAGNLYPMSWLGYPTTVFLLRVGGGVDQDCNENGFPDLCDMPPPFGNCQGPDCSQDCQPNGHPDECDIAYGVSPDCNSNGIPDECDIGACTSTDVNNNLIPDECESLGDLNCDGVTDFADINPFVLYLSNNAAWLAEFPGCLPQNGDINGDGTYGQWSFGDINPFVALLTGG